MKKKKAYYIELLKNYKNLKTMSEELISKAKSTAKDTHSCYANSIDLPAIKQFFIVEEKLKKANLMIEVCNAVAASVNSLDKCYRLVLLLYYVKKLTRDQVMERLSISERTFYRTLNTAESNLKNRMSLLGYDEEWFVTVGQKLLI